MNPLVRGALFVWRSPDAGFFGLDTGRDELATQRKNLNGRILRADSSIQDVITKNPQAIPPNLVADYLAFRKSWDGIYNREIAAKDYQNYQTDLDNARASFESLLGKLKEFVKFPDDVYHDPDSSIWSRWTSPGGGDSKKPTNWSSVLIVVVVAFVVIAALWAFVAVRTRAPQRAFGLMREVYRGEKKGREKAIDRFL